MCQHRTNSDQVHEALDISCRSDPVIWDHGYGKVIWTRLSGTIVDAEALLDMEQNLDIRTDSVIIKRALSRDEVVDLVRKSMHIREMKEREGVEDTKPGCVT